MIAGWRESELIEYVYKRLSTARAASEQRVYVVELVGGCNPYEGEEDEVPLAGSTIVFGKRPNLLQIQEVSMCPDDEGRGNMSE